MDPPSWVGPAPNKSRQSMLAGLSICARHCGRQAGRPSRPVGSARSGRRGSRNPAARRVCHGAQEVAEPWSSPEEVGRPGGRHQFPGIKGLWLGDVHERIHRIHQQRPLAQEGRPDVALGVEVRPDDPQLVEPREQRHHVCDGLALVGGLRLHSGVDCHELEDLVAGPHELAGPLLLVPPPLQQADRHLHVSRLPRDELHALLHQRGRVELARPGALLAQGLHRLGVALEDGREPQVHRDEAPRTQLHRVLCGGDAFHVSVTSEAVCEHSSHRSEQWWQPPIMACWGKSLQEEHHLSISMPRYGCTLPNGAPLDDMVHIQTDSL
mmetsp:Transcript_125843/g.305728  ORF Transcript_125843/g.305728 Transcript_125843/m.305728 type:complete len:324 (-) Transcript_125843:1013-1984(-)